MLDLSSVVNPVLEVAIAVVVALVPVFVNRILKLAESRFHVTVSQTAATAVMTAAVNASGAVKALLRSGAMQLSEVNVSNPAVLKAARVAVSLAGDAADQLGLTEEGVAHLIVSHIEHSLPTAPLSGDEHKAVPVNTTKVVN